MLETSVMESNDTKSFENILNVYWPVIEKAIEVQAYYNGTKGGANIGTAKICPDVTGEMIEALVKARIQCPIKREVI